MRQSEQLTQQPFSARNLAMKSAKLDNTFKDLNLDVDQLDFNYLSNSQKKGDL